MPRMTAMIFAKDLPRMAAFYEQGLGLSVDEPASGTGYVVLRDGDVSLAIHGIPDHIAARVAISDPPEARSENPVKLIFEVADAVATAEHLDRLGGVMFETSGDDAADGLDPEGNVFRVQARR